MTLRLNNLQRAIVTLAGITAAFAFGTALWLGSPLAYIGIGLLGALTLARLGRLRLSLWVDGVLALGGAVIILQSLDGFEGIAPVYVWLQLAAVWMFAWLFIEQLSIALTDKRLPEKLFGLVVPLVFGLMLLFVWEVGTRGARVPTVLLPPPSAIWLKLIESVPILYADFIQTFVKSVLSGYVMGCGAGFVVAVLVDRSPFLKRGLLPIGNFASALPIIGIAPIMVMWFGFDWPSKAAVVVAVTFFPMLVNTVAGLNESSAIERDLMRTYAANYWQTLFRLRLPAAAPFIFNALKINSTLALIGAIVAEFFGTPIVGMGFRISTEVGKLAIDLVWAEIAVAAVAGSVFYGLIALIERAVTFWHPSVRERRA